jgi:hypothetical protein
MQFFFENILVGLTILNPRERIGFAELSRFAGSVLRCLLRSQRALRIYLKGSKISCAELHFVPVLHSLLRRASILLTGISFGELRFWMVPRFLSTNIGFPQETGITI